MSNGYKAQVSVNTCPKRLILLSPPVNSGLNAIRCAAFDAMYAEEMLGAKVPIPVHKLTAINTMPTDNGLVIVTGLIRIASDATSANKMGVSTNVWLTSEKRRI